jgi:hypothetical protein
MAQIGPIPALAVWISGRNPSSALAFNHECCRSHPMPYALFCNDAKLSKTYPTEADVWRFARLSGLVVDVTSDWRKPNPHPVLDNDYEIRPCLPEPHEDPAANKAEAERQARRDPQFTS